MCGIAGIWGEPDERLVREMMGLLEHRGPDAQGIAVRARGVLGHRRLSIMDPGGGDQPILGEAATAIVANGEIYNFRSLRSELEGAHSFRTRSDTESALHLFEDAGPQAVERLDGMFALGIAHDGRLHLARDPLGIKPLYVGRRGASIVFASELKALAGKAENVRAFPPGHRFDSEIGLARYYRVPDSAPLPMPVAQWRRRVRQTLERAVTKRLMSDVPVGAFLSGGLDSSLIAAIARTHLPELHTFSVGVQGSRDLEAARRVARHLDTIHHEHVISPGEVETLLPEIIYSLESFDQDLVRMVESGLALPPDLKLRDGRDKWILRTACEDLLPPEILWRTKEQFDEGSGLAEFLPRLAARHMPAHEARAYASRFPGSDLRSAEEAHYHRVLREVYGERAGVVLANVARWSHRPGPTAARA